MLITQSEGQRKEIRKDMWVNTEELKLWETRGQNSHLPIDFNTKKSTLLNKFWYVFNWEVRVSAPCCP